MGQICIWCSSEFTPRDARTESRYRLPSAGVTICWSCSDLYEQAEVEMHMDSLEALITGTKIHTENGFHLPITIESRWEAPWWRRDTARAVDSYGKRWSLKANGNYVALKPIGDTS